MIRFYHIFLLLALGMSNVSKQETFHSFKLNGTINIDSGKIILMPVNDSSYYPNYHENYKSDIQEGKFCIKGLIAYPSGFLLFVKEGGKLIYLSSMFIVDTGVQSISCDIHAIRKLPSISNNSIKKLMEYNHKFHIINDELTAMEKTYDSLNNLYGDKIPDKYRFDYLNQKDSLIHKADLIFFTYVKKHPNSFVSLWEMVHWLLISGYDNIIDSAYEYLSPSVKNTYTGLILAKKLASSRITGYGKVLPPLNLLNINNQPVIAPTLKPGVKYTLIDFWFSHCQPCISQFNELKHLFNNYRREGFNIIGISTDRKMDTNDWKAVIARFRLPWPQYLDMDGKNANTLSILLYPTNFLLDDKDKIIARDVQPVQLKYFLMKHLK